MTSSNPLLMALQSSIATAQTVTQAAITAAEAQVAANQMPASGASPAVAAAALTNLSAAMTQDYQCCQLSNVLGRMAVNTANAGT